MGEDIFLAEQFAGARGHLRAVAYRMLGSQSEAEDALQETWLRLSQADTSRVENLRAWMTTIIARVCLDALRSRKARREEPIASAEAVAADGDLSSSLEIADSVGVAMLVVLETLSPAERVAFVLHDVFSVPFDDIAPIINRSSAAARQLASRARRRVQGGPADAEADRQRRQEVVAAFLAASRGGDFSALLSVLDPAVVLRADPSAVAASVARLADTPELAPEIRGAEEVAKRFHSRLRMAQPGSVEGDPGLVIAPGGTVRMVIDLVVEAGRIVEISLIADAGTISRLHVQW